MGGSREISAQMSSGLEDRWSYRQARDALKSLDNLLRQTPQIMGAGRLRATERAAEARESVKQEIRRISDAFEDLLR